MPYVIFKNGVIIATEGFITVAQKIQKCVILSAYNSIALGQLSYVTN